jgi:uncharacterized protein (DUF58 family)
MIDKDIILAFINGPGASLAFMWAVFLLFLFALYWTAREYNTARIKRQAKEEAQRDTLHNIDQTLRVMRAEQKSEQAKPARRLGEGDDYG